jgi:hypothetical protein
MLGSGIVPLVPIAFFIAFLIIVIEFLVVNVIIMFEDLKEIFNRCNLKNISNAYDRLDRFFFSFVIIVIESLLNNSLDYTNIGNIYAGAHTAICWSNCSGLNSPSKSSFSKPSMLAPVISGRNRLGLTPCLYIINKNTLYFLETIQYFFLFE